MAEMSQGQPDPRSGARPATPGALSGEALDFLGLDQAFAAADPGEPDDSSWYGTQEGAYQADAAEDGTVEDAWEGDTGAFEGAHLAEYGSGIDADLGGLAADPGGLEGLEDPDFDFEEAEAASWLMELEDEALDDLAQFDLEPREPLEPTHTLDFPLPEPTPRSPWLLAAVVVLSVGAGVGLSKALTRFTAPTADPTAQIALGPRTPVPGRRTSAPPAVDPTPGQPEAAEAPDSAASVPPLGEVAAASEPTPSPEPTATELAPERVPAPPRAEPLAASPQPPPFVAPAVEPPAAAPTPRVVAATPTAAPSGPTPGAAPPRTTPRPVPEPEPVALAPLRGPVREASAEDLAGLWSGSTIPLDAIDGDEHLATPYVGRVRIVARNGEIFEGRLHGLGRGRVWLESGQAKMALMGWQIARIEHVLGDERTPALGRAGSQHLAGLPSVRVRTPGGVFYGKLISQEGSRATLMTAEGARVTLDGGIVEPAGQSRTRVVEVLSGDAPGGR